jgi:hypothetical protein
MNNFLVIEKHWFKSEGLHSLVRFLHFVIIVDHANYTFSYFKNRYNGITDVQFSITDLDKHLQAITRNSQLEIKKLFFNAGV